MGGKLAGPEASRRHVRHASRRAEGLGLRLVSRRGWACWMIWGQMRAGGPQLPAHQQAQPSVPRSGLSNVSETGLRPTTSLTCLRLVSSYASCSAAQADQAFSAQSETALKVCQPETSLRPSPSARLLACLTCRPAQPQPIQRPAQAQLSPASLASGPAQPATRLSQPHPSPSAYLAPRLGLTSLGSTSV